MQSLRHIIKLRNFMSTRVYCVSSFMHFTYNTDNENLNGFKFCTNVTSVNIKRYKFKKTRKTAKEDDYSDSDVEEEQVENDGSKIITGRMQSLRVDAILKTGLGMARNKVETLFYENRILVNGKKINKKSAKLELEDEIDVIKENTNELMMNVSRIVIVSAVENDNSDGLIVKMKRYKHLTIKNIDL